MSVFLERHVAVQFVKRQHITASDRNSHIHESPKFANDKQTKYVLALAPFYIAICALKCIMFFKVI
jgi:hypothetical protein